MMWNITCDILINVKNVIKRKKCKMKNTKLRNKETKG